MHEGITRESLNSMHEGITRESLNSTHEGITRESYGNKPVSLVDPRKITFGILMHLRKFRQSFRGVICSN